MRNDAVLARRASRSKNLILIRPVNGILAMECLHYADEVRSTTEVPVPDGEVKPMELALAKQLIEAASNDAFEPPLRREVPAVEINNTFYRLSKESVLLDWAART